LGRFDFNTVIHGMGSREEIKKGTRFNSLAGKKKQSNVSSMGRKRQVLSMPGQWRLLQRENKSTKASELKRWRVKQRDNEKKGRGTFHL